jgi:hypothetical protein
MSCEKASSAEPKYKKFRILFGCRGLVVVVLTVWPGDVTFLVLNENGVVGNDLVVNNVLASSTVFAIVGAVDMRTLGFIWPNVRLLIASHRSGKSI